MKLALRRLARWAHKWLALIVGIQVLAWVLGGAIFAMLPFETWVKSGDLVRKAPKPTPDMAFFPLAEVAARHPPLHSIELIGQGKNFHYRLTGVGGKKSWVDAADGKLMPRPDEERIRQLARDMYLGDSPTVSVRLISRPEPRAFGLVDELHGKTDVWQVTFADKLNTRLYFTAEIGEFVRARNDAWVIYDFFWRLHIMDYFGGEDFNNALLRILSPLALVLVLSGIVMLYFTRFRNPRT